MIERRDFLKGSAAALQYGAGRKGLAQRPAPMTDSSVTYDERSVTVDGRAVGRHWLIEAASPAGTPSQRYYHIPADWLQPSNEIVILEEQAASPANVQLQARV